MPISKLEGVKILVHGYDIVNSLTFLPKILILWSSMTFCHNEIILKLFEKREQDRESMNSAYIRFISGKFGIQIDEVVENRL